MTKVTIDGKDYTVKFSMRTAIRYERKTGHKLGEFIITQDATDNSDASEYIFDMIDIMLEMAGAPIIEDLSLQDFGTVIPACMGEINGFLLPQKGDTLNIPEATESEDPDEEKN